MHTAFQGLCESEMKIMLKIMMSNTSQYSE